LSNVDGATERGLRMSLTSVSEGPSSTAVFVEAEGAEHYAAVLKTLAWADEAAAEGDYKDALYFLAVVQASDGLSPDYLVKLRDWKLHQSPRAVTPVQ
jgi:hypothetical protein